MAPSRRVLVLAAAAALAAGAARMDAGGASTRPAGKAELAGQFSAHFDKAYGNKNIDPAVRDQCPGK